MGRETNKQRRERQAASTREKAAAARAVQARAQQRKRATAILSSTVVVAVVGALIAYLVIHSSSSDNNPGRTSATTNVVDTVTGITPAALQTVAGGGTSPLATPTKSTDKPLVKGGKPEVLYVGAEFCPHCGAERWALLQAFSRFGKFKNISEIHSAATDGDIATFSFYKSSYTSKYVTFTPIEAEDRNQNPLETPTKDQQAVFTEYTTGFPFIDFGGKYYQKAAGIDYTLLSGMSQTQIAAQLKDPTSKVAQAILGESNNLTATICKLTDNKPANVCSAPQVTAIQGQLGA